MTFSGPSSFIVWSRFQFHQIKLGNWTIFQHDGHISWLRNEISNHLHNIASIANAVPVTLYSRVTMNVEIVVLNCQSLLSCSLRVFWKCQCHCQFAQFACLSLWSNVSNVFVIVVVSAFVFAMAFLLVRSFLLITLIKCLKGHKSLGWLFEGAL